MFSLCLGNSKVWGGRVRLFEVKAGLYLFCWGTLMDSMRSVGDFLWVTLMCLMRLQLGEGGVLSKRWTILSSYGEF